MNLKEPPCGQRNVKGAAGGRASVVSVQLLVAGSGLGENEGLRAARWRSRWLREGSVRAGENSDEEESRTVMSGCCRVRSEMRGAATGLCRVELETVRRKWKASVLRAGPGRVRAKTGVAALVREIKRKT
uniref:Uncharacterized protein n=1 Tax=Populus alba TaxID=43335 RepID=A0A4U5MXS1_POPAL|nr:hypothetical protein D5086_0000291930 [Populus alba]